MIIIEDIYPKSIIYVVMYTDNDIPNEKPIVFINDNLLTLKSKIANFFYNFFKVKRNFFLIAFILLLIFGTEWMYNKLFISIEATNQIISKNELINQKIFEYYKKQGLNPSIIQYDIIETPTGFYDQESLKKIYLLNVVNDRF